jgi:hypothetical protein
MSDGDVADRLRRGRLGWFVVSARVGALDQDVPIDVKHPASA